MVELKRIQKLVLLDGLMNEVKKLVSAHGKEPSLTSEAYHNELQELVTHIQVAFDLSDTEVSRLYETVCEFPVFQVRECDKMSEEKPKERILLCGVWLDGEDWIFEAVPFAPKEVLLGALESFIQVVKEDKLQTTFNVEVNGQKVIEEKIELPEKKV